MNIPTTFKVANRTWRVKRVNLKTCLGRCIPGKALIEIDSKITEEELLIHTFLHELLHATAGTLGWSKVNEDENRLDALAALLAQAFATAE